MKNLKCISAFLLATFLALTNCKTTQRENLNSGSTISAVTSGHECSVLSTEISFRVGPGTNHEKLSHRNFVMSGEKFLVLAEADGTVGLLNGDHHWVKAQFGDDIGYIATGTKFSPDSWVSCGSQSFAGGGGAGDPNSPPGNNSDSEDQVIHGIQIKPVQKTVSFPSHTNGYLNIHNPAQVGHKTSNTEASYGPCMPVAIAGKQFQGRIKHRGNLTTNFPNSKKSLTIDFKDCPNTEFPKLFGDNRKRVVFNSALLDPSFMRSWLIMEIIREHFKDANNNGFAPKHEFVLMQVTNHDASVRTPSLFIATYDPTEHIKNTDDDKFKEAYIAKGDKNNKWEYRNPDPNHKPYEITDGPDGVDKNDALNRYNDLLSRHCNGERRINEHEFAIFNFVHHFFAATDTWEKNFYMFSLAPFNESTDVHIYNWDADFTLGLHFCGGGVCYNQAPDFEGRKRNIISDWRSISLADPSANDGYGHGYAVCFNSFYRDHNQRSAYYQKYLNALNQILIPNKLHAIIDAQSAIIRNAAIRDTSNWPRPNRNPGFDSEVNLIKQAIDTRYNLILPRVQRCLGDSGGSCENQ
ncbi:MAG: CotH kinase family protein [Oligoflexales bacterium]|nr:CotH kinase family protein [Oligoflexales bacterium]